jgi:DnaJ-class molecular chaperone
VKYYVIAKDTCPECKGTGRIVAPIKLNSADRADDQCLNCDGCGELMTETPFADALRQALDELRSPQPERCCSGKDTNPGGT